jgi:hypothetical protein
LRLWSADAFHTAIDGSIKVVGEGTIVMGKHIATGGLDFYTSEPIARLSSALKVKVARRSGSWSN